MLRKLEALSDRLADLLGAITACVMIIMVANVFADVVMRYFFKVGFIAWQEMEWHLFSVVFLLGISYTVKEDGHVRVDLIYDNLSVRNQALINIIGSLFFLITFSLLIAFGSFDFVLEAYHTGEISGDPGGLTHRWIIKALLPISFFILILITIGNIIKQINRFASDGRGENREEK